MPIRIEEMNEIDFSDVTSGGKLHIVTPGDILLHDFMEPYGLSANALARAVHVPANRITAILAATRGVTADTALRLARYFGTTPQFWMNLQSRHDLCRAEARSGDQIERQIHRGPIAQG